MSDYIDQLLAEGYADAMFEQSEEERRLREKKWMTVEGDEVKVSHMTDSHLINSYNMMLRGGKGHFPVHTREAIEMLEEEVERRGLGERARLLRS